MALKSARSAIFLDKDGTLLENVPYNADPAQMRLAAGCTEGLRRLADAGFALVVVSNQSGVARGFFPEDALAGVQARLAEMLAEAGAPLAGFYYCPHHPEALLKQYRIECFCRKPSPGLLLQASRELNIALDRSWMIGDILDDVEAGRRAGCRSVLIRNGGETEWRISPLRRPDFMARSINQAAEHILEQDERNRGTAEQRPSTGHPAPTQRSSSRSVATLG